MDRFSLQFIINSASEARAVHSKFHLPSLPLLPSEILTILKSSNGSIDQYLASEVYANSSPDYLALQKDRLIQTVLMHQQRVGEQPTYLLRAPGRLNAFLEYLDMCAGDHMSTTIDGDIPLAVTPRGDDVLDVANMNPLFPSEVICIQEEFSRFASAPLGSENCDAGDTWDYRTRVVPYYGRPKGDWLNYVLGSYLRVVWDLKDQPINGAYLTFGPSTAPFRAGTSSSSAVVVLAFLALFLTNQANMPDWSKAEVCRLLGEAEWYVGTHGGANDQTTILCNPANAVLYNRHSREELESTPLPFLQGLHIIVANSLWEVNKSLGGNQSFNMRKSWMELGDTIMRMVISAVTDAIAQGKASESSWISSVIRERLGFTHVSALPCLESDLALWEKITANYNKFGSLDPEILGIPVDAIEELISILPVKVTVEEAASLLNTDKSTILAKYTRPVRSIGGYHTRTTARFFFTENLIGKELERIFLEAESRIQSGELTPDSAEYDQYRMRVGELLDRLQHTLCYDFRVSTPQLDRLLSIARRGPGYLGGKLTGAGKGGCVCILVREDQSGAMCEYLDAEYYNKPSNFEEYRQILHDSLRYFHDNDFERVSAEERLSNLEKALSAVKDQRHVVTFSRGACALDFSETVG